MIFNLHICPLLENQHLNLFRFNFDCLVFCFPGQPSVCVLPKKNYNYIRCGNLITLELIQLQFLIKHEKVVKIEPTRDRELHFEPTNTYFEKVISQV